MSLYQEVRPTNFDEVVGNSVTIGGLRNMLKKPTQSRSHAIMLKGPSGCGKTTIARILAIEFGSNEDSTFELNAANTTGIDTIRSISETADLKGLGGRTKTYIFDESHQFSGAAQQALLKIIEDNPPHCYFIFCTTEPDKIISTIRNRCTEYQVKLLLDDEITEVLNRAIKKILDDEDIPTMESRFTFLTGLISSNNPDHSKAKLDEVKEEAAILKNRLYVLGCWKNISSDIKEAVTYTCEGSPRAALVSLEEVVGIKNVDDALELLVHGTEKDASVLDLLKLLVMSPVVRRKKWKQIITTFDAIDENSEVIRKSILTFLFNKLKKQDKVEDALDITHLLRIFSVNTFYGKKSQLSSLIARACFETWKD